MKKCTAIVVYNSKEKIVYSIGINHNGNLINFTLNDKFSTFTELYRTILETIKNNNFRVSHYEEFGCKWYDITWINVCYPGTLNKYGTNLED